MLFVEVAEHPRVLDHLLEAHAVASAPVSVTLAEVFAEGGTVDLASELETFGAEGEDASLLEV